jgi:hypothetical protein
VRLERFQLESTRMRGAAGIVVTAHARSGGRGASRRNSNATPSARCSGKPVLKSF